MEKHSLFEDEVIHILHDYIEFLRDNLKNKLYEYLTICRVSCVVWVMLLFNHTDYITVSLLVTLDPPASNDMD